MPSESRTYPESASAPSPEGAEAAFLAEDPPADSASSKNALPPREDVVALASWCTAPKGSGCQRCVAACPAQAITLTDQGPLIDEGRCTRCGICAGICDAFAWRRITLEDLVGRAVREAKNEGMVCFTCNEHIFPGLAPRSNVIVLPCLAAVPPEFWSALLAENIEVGIFVDRSYCNECTIAGPYAQSLYDHAIDHARNWTGRSLYALEGLPERESILSMYANIDEADRRHIFSTLANESIDIATGKHRQRNAGTVDEFYENQERLRAQGRIRSAQQAEDLPEVFRQKPEWPRQKLIVQATQKLPHRAACLERYQSETDVSLCKQNHHCVNACPTGARSVNEEGYPEVDEKRCIACGICIASCPEGACHFISITAQNYCERIPHDENA